MRGYAGETVPEHVFALLLALARQIGPFHRSVAAGAGRRKSEQFCYFDYPIRDLAGQTLSILGGGTLGQGVARIGATFGMRVVFGEHKDAAACRRGLSALRTPDPRGPTRSVCTARSTTPPAT